MDPNYKAKSSEFYEAVGRALSTWQPIEINLALLYANLVGSQSAVAAFASFGVVASLNTRLQMLDAAAQETLKGPDADTFERLTKKVRRASSERNKLAHWMYNAVVDDSGQVDIFLADARKGPTAPDQSAVRLEDIKRLTENWSELLLELLDFVRTRVQPVS